MEENHYIFILGRNADISIAEIRAVFEKNGWDDRLVLESREVLIVSSENASAELLHKTLGGTIKIGKVEKISLLESLETDLSVDFLLDHIFLKTTGKIQFGISVYNGGDRYATDELASKITGFSKGIKALLEQKGQSVRFAYSRDRFLSSVTVDKNKLIQKGAEILLIPTRDAVFIGKTLSVQEFEEFSKRDYGRPARDLKSGIMPPKLARMMINLAEIGSADLLLDPFCGSGTVLQEALLLGHTNIIGRDITDKAITDTKANLEWLGREMKLPRAHARGIFSPCFVGSKIPPKQKLLRIHPRAYAPGFLRRGINFDSNPKIDVAVGDATKLSSSILPESISAIVTEPYLGPTLHGQLYPEKLQNITRELGNLYLKAFSEFQKILKPGGAVVMVLPAFVQRNGAYFLPILSEITKLGFTQDKFGDSVRGTVTYGNKYDFVLREIVKFKKA